MGIPARHKPENLASLHEKGELFTMFQESVWIEYFYRLSSFDVNMTLQFSINLNDTHSTVRGLWIDIIK